MRVPPSLRSLKVVPSGRKRRIESWPRLMVDPGPVRWPLLMTAPPIRVAGRVPVAADRSGSHLIRRAREPSGRGIVVPEKAIEQLAAGNRPPVLVTVNGNLT